MQESKFMDYLINDSNITSKNKAVSSRMSRARAVEKTLNLSLDEIVDDDKKMYQSLIRINEEMKNANGNYSNALRKYYTFKTGKKFPRIEEFYDENCFSV
ncbi:MAG: hypothetical protein PHO29_01875 [Acetobacterium sp.]|nr:hypothetical protein [Acetobacterium sp.]